MPYCIRGPLGSIDSQLDPVAARWIPPFPPNPPTPVGAPQGPARLILQPSTPSRVLSLACDPTLLPSLLQGPARGIPKEKLAERVAIFQPFQVTTELLALAKPDCIFMNCLPAPTGAASSLPTPLL